MIGTVEGSQMKSPLVSLANAVSKTTRAHAGADVHSGAVLTQDRPGRNMAGSSSALADSASVGRKNEAPKERRSEPRRKVNAELVLTPLDDVTKHLRGVALNVSTRGIMVRLDRSAGRFGEKQIYRIETRSKRMLCEVRHSAVVPASVEVGFEILSSPPSADLFPPC
jgi:hypothetical protein